MQPPCLQNDFARVQGKRGVEVVLAGGPTGDRYRLQRAMASMRPPTTGIT